MSTLHLSSATCEVVEIHGVGSVGVLLERVAHHLAAVALWREAEGVVHGWLNDDLVAGLREDVDHHANAFHDAWDEAEPLKLDVPLVVVVEPLLHGGPIVLRLDGVAEERVVEAMAKRFGDKRRCFEIHVGHP